MTTQRMSDVAIWGRLRTVTAILGPGGVAAGATHTLYLSNLIKLEARIMRIERKIWSAHRGDFIATGETMDVDINAPGRDSKSSVSSGRFLKGPIPWFWVTAAAALPGQALPVGLCLWRLVGAMRSDTVSFGNADLRPLGIDRAAKSRALRALERAGLIAVVHRPGRFPRVTVLRDYEPRGMAVGPLSNR
jgi:hypothetical protein